MEVIIYLGQLKEILNHFGVILGPFGGPLGTILGRFWGYLAQFDPILSHFGIILGPFLGYLEQFWNHLGNIFEFKKSAPKTFGQTDFFPGRLKDAPCETAIFNLVKKGLRSFLTPWEALLLPISRPHFGTRFAQEAAKMSPRGPSGASKTKKQPFQNPWKTYCF